MSNVVVIILKTQKVKRSFPFSGLVEKSIASHNLFVTYTKPGVVPLYRHLSTFVFFKTLLFSLLYIKVARARTMRAPAFALLLPFICGFYEFFQAFAQAKKKNSGIHSARGTPPQSYIYRIA